MATFYPGFKQASHDIQLTSDIVFDPSLPFEDEKESDYFSSDYTSSRLKFLQICASKLEEIKVHTLCLKGKAGKKYLAPDGSDLAIDLAVLGNLTTATKVLILSSGVHGTEGFPGAAVQLRLLKVAQFPVNDGDFAAIIIHAVNPYGMAWLRRSNENNVDLNRNCLTEEDVANEKERESEKNKMYAEIIDPILNPDEIGKCDCFLLRVACMFCCHSPTKLKQATVSGQRCKPNGLFYSGQEPEESVTLLAEWLRKNLYSQNQQNQQQHEDLISIHKLDEAVAELKQQQSTKKKIIHLDFHSGGFDYLHDKILTENMTPDLEASFGRENLLDVSKASIQKEADGEQESSMLRYNVSGSLANVHSLAGAFSGEMNVDVNVLVQEFGTSSPPIPLLQILRKENIYHRKNIELMNMDQANAYLDVPEKRAIRYAYYMANDEPWKNFVLKRGLETTAQACSLLNIKLTFNSDKV